MKSMKLPKNRCVTVYYFENSIWQVNFVYLRVGRPCKMIYHFCCNESNLIHYSEDEA